MVDSNNAAAAASNAMQGLVSALQDITQELNSAQGQLQYWRVEADAWKARFEQERARNVRLRRVLRAHGSPRPMAATLSAQPSLVVSPRAGRCPSGTGDGPQLWHTQSAIAAPAADAASSGSGSAASLPPTQHLRPLKCVTEEACTSAAGQHSTLVQPGSAHTPLAWLTASSTEGTPLSAVAAAAAAGGAGSSLHDPFRSVQQRSLVTVSDCGVPACSLQQEQLQQQNGDAANCSSSTTRSNSRLATTSTAEAPEATGGASTSTAAEAPEAPLPSVASFRRSHTLPVTSSFTFARSPRFAGGSNGSFLTPAGAWLPPSGSRHTVDQLLRVMMAFTLAATQGTGGSDGTDDAPGGAGQSDEDALPSVSLDDDDGSSGVGLAAAAAVSAAMARAWASAASNEQRAVAAAAAAATGSNGSSKPGSKEGGGSSSGRAGFRLVATVTNKMGKRPASTTALSSYASQDSLDASTLDLASLAPASHSHNASKDSSRPGSSGSLSRLISPSPITSAAAAAAAAAAGGVSGVGNTSSGSGLPPPSPGSPSLAAPAAAAAGPPAPAVAAARSAAAVPAVGGAPNTGQATTISLQWLSRPRTVLVMRKLAPTTESAFLRALDWLRRHRVTMFVEPKVFQELVDSGRVVPVPEQPQQQQLSRGSAAAGAGGSSSLALPGSSSGSLCGMLVSTAQHAPSAAAGALAPSISWPGPSLSSSGGGAGGSNAPADKAAAGGMPPASPPSAAAAGGASAATANIKTWQPELHITQQQQQAAAEGGDCGCQVSVSDLIPDAVAQQLDLVVVLGGDGTVLWTCHIFGNRSVPPLVPFNLGSLGFLTPFDPARLEQVLLKAFRGGFPITLRHRLHCTIVRCSGGAAAAAAASPAPPQQQQQQPGGDDSGLPCVSRSCVGHCVYGEEHVSLNEVVIERGISPFLSNLECFCDGTFVTHVQGDGLIVGTPTGSTAYSLAAGGSMVHPQVPCILFTPICPHSLSFRPLMFPDYVQLCVQVPADARGHVWASFDGKDRTELGPGDAVVIRLSKWPIPSVAAEADPSSDWFNAVRECLHWNLRKVQGGVGM